jgi:putative ABC transport system permease protein
MPPLSRRNLFHDKIRLVVSLTGITFAVLLVVVEPGLFPGFSTTTSSLIDRSRADLWIASRNVSYIEQGSPFSERKLYQVRATPGVAFAEKYIARFASWKHDDGGHESVPEVGFNVGELPQPASGGRAGESGRVMGGPWNITAGTVAECAGCSSGGRPLLEDARHHPRPRSLRTQLSNCPSFHIDLP